VKQIGFVAERIPNFEEVNLELAKLTGFQLQAVPGIVPDRDFFELVAARRFPCTTWLRKMSQLDYLEEPDMFHDVFGHVPLLTNAAYCDFLVGLSNLALEHIEDEWAIQLLSRIYWYTIEFGLIHEEDGSLRIYGAGIISSKGETVYSLEEELPRHHFEVGQIMDSSYIKEKFQEQYFIIEGYEELYGSLKDLEGELAKRLNK
jgi:phenylalanine-4-hydroxylase